LAVCPFRPLRGEVLEQEFAQRFAVVAYDASACVGAALIVKQKFREELFEVVTSSLGKLFEQ
jgi:hypothetical protein